ncbi:hypothetical protein HHK36_016953 [Tetracentron sinense]|uniref:MATH domain-containing protein n=1 Tax=Tetracentron sinense TaxID=13715 RepID=A0A835DEQ6_TETSI|nr:hypothetical protein HHK36_016953 [Tetracentron sinense]
MTNKIGKPSTARVSFSLSEVLNLYHRDACFSRVLIQSAWLVLLDPTFLLQEGDGDGEMLLPHSDFTQVPQPMEVAQAETATAVENQLVEDPPLSSFRWTIENFSRLNNKKYYSPIFLSGSYKWRVLIFLKGNNVDHFSMYLDVADSTNLPYRWSRCAQFSLAVVNQIHNKYTVRKYQGVGDACRSNDSSNICLHSVDTQHQFNARNSDWGFTSFMPLSELYDPARGYLVNDTCIIQAKVVVRRVVNDTKDIIWEPLIVNDEETMAVKMEPEGEAIISAEGITEEPAITNEEPSTTPEPLPPWQCHLHILLQQWDHLLLRLLCLKKYGDITHKNNIKNLKLKAAYIETICGIISGLKGTTAQGFKMTSINQCESDLEDVENTKIDVSWLKDRLNMVRTIQAQSIQVSVMGDSFKAKTETLAKLTASIAEDNSKIEDTRKEIAKHEALIMKYQESLNAKKEEFNAVQHAITTQHEEFVRLRNSCTIMTLKSFP